MFSSVTDVSRGKFPMDTSKRSHEAPMVSCKLQVVSCNGFWMPKLITTLRLTATRNRKVALQLLFAANSFAPECITVSLSLRLRRNFRECCEHFMYFN